MLKIELDRRNLYEVIKDIRSQSAVDLLVEITAECPFLENRLAFRIIRNEARSAGKRIAFTSRDKSLSRLVENLNVYAEDFGFVRGFDVGAPPVVQKSSLKPDFFGWLGPFFKERLSINRDIGFIVAVISGLLLLGFYLLFYHLPRATVTLSVGAESLIEVIDVTASPSAQAVDSRARVIPSVKVATSAKKTVTAPATGSKEVGDKAKGEVTVYNKTDSSRTFPAKTSLSRGRTQGADLLYLTDNEILVPAAYGGVSGVATVSATAEKIGDEYNSLSNINLSVASSPTNSVIAESNRNFSGGSRRSVTIVTDDDQKKLLASAKAELDASLATEIRGKAVTDQKLEEGSLSFTTVIKSFDKSVGEEASSFSLLLEESAEASVYSQNDLKKLLGDVLKEYVPENYELFGGEESSEVIAVKYDAGNLFLTTKVRGFIVPKIDEQKIIDDLAGLRLSLARRYLDNLGNVATVQIESSPNLPGLDFLPRNKSAIKIIVTRK